MNSIISEKIKQLDNAKKFECWYLVKHNTDFCNLCYLVDALKYQQRTKIYQNVQSAIEARINNVVESKNLSLSSNYRALRVAAFFGLIEMTSTKYDDALISPVFYEIESRCSGNYEKKELYQDIIDRQIEKLFVSSIIDEEREGVRKGFKIYPIMFLYKILIELGKATGIYSISNIEYSYFVATTQKYENFLDTLLLIKLNREDPNVEKILSQFDEKFDNRMNKAIELLSFLDCSNGRICIKKEYVDYVAKKVFTFENNNYLFSDNDYIKFLCSSSEIAAKSTKSDCVVEKNMEIEFDFSSSPIKDGYNLIVYGTPGCGKSYYVEHTLLDGYSKENYIRTTFYPDYTNTDFVGQILPLVEGEKVTYKFNPGPLTLALERAIRNPNEKVALVIEELNRGNAASIFGDVFQLLDRKEGVSEYSIINVNIINYLNEQFDDEYTFSSIRLPGNLSIFATMNTSDQNVFTLDTAFKRRWKFKKLMNIFTPDHEFMNYYVPGANITWKELVNAINDYILNVSDGFNSEDKQLGVYFVDKKGMRQKVEIEADQVDLEEFSYKFLEYLWDDVAKFQRSKWFNSDIKSLDQLIEEYKNTGLKVFNDDIFNK